MACRLFIGLVALLAPTLQAAERIVSINQCADEFLLNIVPRENILSVTHFVKDSDVSWDAHLAVNIPGNSGRAEEVMSYDPELVFAGDFSSRSTVKLLRSVGVEVVELPHPESVLDVLALIKLVGEVTGHQAAAENLLERVMSQSKPLETNLTAAVYQPNGFTTGQHTLVDDVLATAGVINIAARRGLANYARYPIEALLVDQPDLLILDPQVHATPSLAHEFLKHPALRAAFSTTRTVEVPPQAWACGTHHVFAAVQLIQKAVDSIE